MMRAPGGAGRRGGGPGPPGWCGGCGGRMGGSAAGSGGQAHGRHRLSLTPASASVGVPSLWRLWRRPWWSAACLGGGLRQLVRLGSSPRGEVDGGGARRAPRSVCGGSCAVVALRLCRGCVGQRSAGWRRCDLHCCCPTACGCECWFGSGENLTARCPWMSLSSLGGRR
jgi:hypothetical protein